MKKPDKAIVWYNIVEKNSEFVDWNGKPAKEYHIEIPFWLARAYKLHNHSPVQVCLYAKKLSYAERDKKSTHAQLTLLFKSNYLKKVTKMRKLNHNYMQIINKK